MAVIAYRRKTRSWTKPPLGSQIDWSHPLAKGLACCFLLNENGGTQVFDLVNRISMPLFGSPPWSNGTLQTTSNSLYGSVSWPATLRGLAMPMSIVWQGTSLGTPAANSAVFGIWDSGGGNPPFTLAIDGSSFLAFRVNTNIGNASDSAGVGLSGKMQVAATLGLTATGGNPVNVYVNAVNKFSGGALSGASINYATPILTFNNASPYSSNANAAHEFGLIYSVAQSASNLAWLAAEPYAYIQPPVSSRHITLSFPDGASLSRAFSGFGSFPPSP